MNAVFEKTERFLSGAIDLLTDFGAVHLRFLRFWRADQFLRESGGIRPISFLFIASVITSLPPDLGIFLSRDPKHELKSWQLLTGDLSFLDLLTDFGVVFAGAVVLARLLSATIGLKDYRELLLRYLYMLFAVAFNAITLSLFLLVAIVFYNIEINLVELCALIFFPLGLLIAHPVFALKDATVLRGSPRLRPMLFLAIGPAIFVSAFALILYQNGVFQEVVFQKPPPPEPQSVSVGACRTVASGAVDVVLKNVSDEDVFIDRFARIWIRRNRGRQRLGPVRGKLKVKLKGGLGHHERFIRLKPGHSDLLRIDSPESVTKKLRLSADRLQPAVQEVISRHLKKEEKVRQDRLRDGKEPENRELNPPEILLRLKGVGLSVDPVDIRRCFYGLDIWPEPTPSRSALEDM